MRYAGAEHDDDSEHGGGILFIMNETLQAHLAGCTATLTVAVLVI